MVEDASHENLNKQKEVTWKNLSRQTYVQESCGGRGERSFFPRVLQW